MEKHCVKVALHVCIFQITPCIGRNSPGLLVIRLVFVQTQVVEDGSNRIVEVSFSCLKFPLVTHSIREPSAFEIFQGFVLLF